MSMIRCYEMEATAFRLGNCGGGRVECNDELAG
jgi:hypothetical protein